MALIMGSWGKENGPGSEEQFIVSLSLQWSVSVAVRFSFREKTTGALGDRVLTKLSPARTDKGETIQWDD